VTSAPGLGVEGSLSFAVQDGSRTASGTVRGTGDTVTVEVDRPWVVLRSVRDVGFGEDAGRLLETSGITFDVQGPHGRLALAGPDVHSRLGRLLTGSDHLRPYPGGLLASRTLTRVGVVSAVALGAGLILAVTGHRGARR
jgi:hypothetical protein